MIYLNDRFAWLNTKVTNNIKDVAASWFDVEAQRTASISQPQGNSNYGTAIANQNMPLRNNMKMRSATWLMNDGITERAIIQQTANNNHISSFVLMIGNSQYKVMQDAGSLSECVSKQSTANYIGGLSRRSVDFTRNITDDNGSYLARYATKVSGGYKWSIKALLNQFYIGYDDDIADGYINSLANDYERNPAAENTAFYFGYDIATRTYTTTSVRSIDATLNFDESKQVSVKIGGNTTYYFNFVTFGYDIAIRCNRSWSDDLCILKLSKWYDGANIQHLPLSGEDFCGGWGITYDEDSSSWKRTGNPITGEDIEVKKGEYVCVFGCSQLLYILNQLTPTPESVFPTYPTSVTCQMVDVVKSAAIYTFFPPFNVKTILQVWMAQTGIELRFSPNHPHGMYITQRKGEVYNTLVDSYEVKYDKASIYKGYKNYVKLAAGEIDEESVIIQTITINTTQMQGLDDEADVVTLPAREYWGIAPTTLPSKTYTRCVEVKLHCYYYEFRKIENINLFGYIYRVIEGKWSNGVATLQCLL